MRNVGHQRAEGRRAAKPEQSLRQRQRADAAGNSGKAVTGAQDQRAKKDRHNNAETISEPAHDDAADAEPEHRQRKWKRSLAARDAEIGLHCRQRDHERPHADAADGAEQKRHGKPRPGVVGIDPACRLRPGLDVRGH